MNFLLQTLKSGGEIKAGRFTIYAFPDGTLIARKEGSGLISPNEKPTLMGLRRILWWMEQEAA